KIQSPIAVNVRGGDASTDHRFGQAESRSDVVVTPVATAHEKRVPIVPAQIGAGSKARPKARIVDDLVVAGAEGLEFGPAVDFSFDKPAGLHGFQHAVVVEISQTRFKGKSAAGEAELFTAMHVGGDGRFHFPGLTGAQPKEVAFGQAKSRGNIAHINVQKAVP